MTRNTFYRTSVFLSIVLALSVGTFAQRELPIAEVQGQKNLSPHVGAQVRVTGIVTARTNTGFFLQTPDDKIDKDPLTSEGIFIFTKDKPMAEAAIGSEVAVSGTVVEYKPRNVIATLTITEVSHFLGRDSFRVVSKSNPLPKPVKLTLADFAPNLIDQLERFEGMRVVVDEVTVVAPTGGRVEPKTESVVSNGVFFAVLKGMRRPFREPGMEIIKFLTSPDREQWKKDVPDLPLFDGNPEILRIDTSEQEGSTILNVTSRAELKNIVGVMHYGWSRYTILTDADAKIDVTSRVRRLALPAATDAQFTVAVANIESLFDDVDDPGIREEVVTTEAFQKRLGKISIAVRDLLQFPDVFAVVEAENINALKRLAERINKDAVAAGKPDPKYEAYLFEGNDGRGIDNGFLVKSSRVTVSSAKQIGKNDKYKHPGTKNDVILNDRTPIVIEISVAGPAGIEPFRAVIVNNHLKSLRGVDDPDDGPNVRMKKKLQAEFLARWIDARQKADPSERLMIVGDLNGFQFNDGLIDVVGTIKGKPAPAGSVLLPTEDLIETDLINLVELITPSERYSYTFDGNAQTLDHFLINVPTRRHLEGFGFLRINADYPQILRAVPNTPERFSDHDVAVAYFNIAPAQPKQP